MKIIRGREKLKEEAAKVEKEKKRMRLESEKERRTSSRRKETSGKLLKFTLLTTEHFNILNRVDCFRNIICV